MIADLRNAGTVKGDGRTLPTPINLEVYSVPFERNLSVHPEVRTLGRLEAARTGVHMRFVVGSALDRLAAQRELPTKPNRLLNHDRVSLVASADPETWERLDKLRATSGLTWNALVDIALGGGSK